MAVVVVTRIHHTYDIRMRSEILHILWSRIEIDTLVITGHQNRINAIIDF